MKSKVDRVKPNGGAQKLRNSEGKNPTKNPINKGRYQEILRKTTITNKEKNNKQIGKQQQEEAEQKYKLFACNLAISVVDLESPYLNGSQA